jgi:hypothetical protein
MNDEIDLSKIPSDKMLNDWLEVLKDIALCEKALELGITEYHGNSVQERLDANKQARATIEAELEIREIALPEL